MRSWLLLVSLLVPLGHGDWVMGYFSCTLCRKLLLSGRMAPKGPEMILTQTECFQTDGVRSSSLYWARRVHNDHGHTLSHQDSMGIIHRNHIPAPVVCLHYGEGRRVPAFRARSNAPPALHVLRETPPSEAGGEASPLTMDIIEDSPDSECAGFVHHHRTASGHSFQAFLLEKSKGRASATILQLQKLLTRRYYAATSVIIPCCPKGWDIKPTMNIKKTSGEEVAQPEKRQKESTQRAMDIKALMQHDGQQPSVSQQDIFRAATLHSGSPSVKTSHTSQLEIRRHAASVTKTNEQLNSEDDSSFQKLSVKAASGVVDGGFYVKRQLLLVSRENKGYRNRLQYKIRPARDDNNEYLTKQAELRRPGGDSKTEQSHIETENHERLAYVLQTDSTHKTDNRDAARKQTLSDVGETVLITEPSSEGKLIPNTDMRWKIANIYPLKKLGDPRPITKAMKLFNTRPDNSKYICLKGSSLEMYVIDRTARIDIKPAERAAKVTPVSAEEQVKETNHTPPENTSMNHTKEEENMPSEDSAVPSAASPRTAETTTASMEAFHRGSTEKADGQPSREVSPTARASPRPGSDAEPRFTKCKTENIRAVSSSGLRMREDIQADTSELHKGPDGEDRASTPRTETEGGEHHNGRGGKSLSNPLGTIEKAAAGERPKPTADTVPLCRALIHRTEAGWKHCVERLGGTPSNTLSFWEPTDAGEKEPTRGRGDNLLDDDGNDHFYYFDGVLKRVQTNPYPYYKRQRPERSHGNMESGGVTEREERDARENLLGYIRRRAY